MSYKVHLTSYSPTITQLPPGLIHTPSLCHCCCSPLSAPLRHQACSCLRIWPLLFCLTLRNFPRCLHDFLPDLLQASAQRSLLTEPSLITTYSNLSPAHTPTPLSLLYLSTLLIWALDIPHILLIYCLSTSSMRMKMFACPLMYSYHLEQGLAQSRHLAVLVKWTDEFVLYSTSISVFYLCDPI